MLIGYICVPKNKNASEDLHETLKALGCERIFVETVAGEAQKRPQLQAALESAQAGDTLVIWNLWQLANSLTQLVKIIQSLEQKQIAFHAIQDKLDSSTDAGKTIFQVFAALAGFERERTRKRFITAHEWGKLGGKPFALSDADIQVAKEMFQDESISINDIAAHFGVSAATIYRYFPGGRKVSKD